MDRTLAYRGLCGLLGALLACAGVVFVATFFRANLPGGEVAGPLSPLGPNGVYFMAFTGTALLGWGGGLLGAARHPESSGILASVTALALVLSAIYRMFGWAMGDYGRLGDLLRVEAAVFLLLALGFVWLKPTASTAPR